MNKRLQWFIFIKEGWRNPLVYFMLSNYERDDFCSTFTVFDFGQFLTFPEMSLTFILLPPDCLFIVFKHSWVYISHNYTLLRFFRNILKNWLQKILASKNIGFRKYWLQKILASKNSIREGCLKQSYILNRPVIMKNRLSCRHQIIIIPSLKAIRWAIR